MLKKYYKKICIFFFFILAISGCNMPSNFKTSIVNNVGDGLSTASTTIVSNPIVSQDVSINTPRKVLSEFTTNFKYPKGARAYNIRKASDAINGYVIYPSETFSFNATTGQTGKKNGYKISKIFYKGKEKKGYGGGVCQVSTTLYNAALNLGLEINERHSHSKDVDYVEKGKDAAVTYNSVDLKFTNILTYPIKINSSVKDTSITVALEML